MYAKYSINVWFIEFKRFYKQLAIAFGHFQLLVFIPIWFAIKLSLGIFFFFIASPKLMRVNAKGEREEVMKVEANFPRLF